MDLDLHYADNIAQAKEWDINTNEYLFFVQCTQGRLEVTVNQQVLPFEVNDVIIYSPKLGFVINNRTNDFDARIVAISAAAYDHIVYQCSHMDTYFWEKINYISSNPIIHLNDRQKQLVDCHVHIYKVYQQETIPSPYSKQLQSVYIHAITYELLMYIEEQLKKEQLITITAGNKQTQHTANLFRSFVRLLHSNEGRIREVAWYAKQLGISAKYLNFVTQKCCNRSPMEMITETTCRELRRQLLEESDSIKDIAERMNFANLSFFCKYVRQHMGVSPLKFRSQNQ